MATTIALLLSPLCIDQPNGGPCAGGNTFWEDTYAEVLSFDVSESHFHPEYTYSTDAINSKNYVHKP